MPVVTSLSVRSGIEPSVSSATKVMVITLITSPVCPFVTGPVSFVTVIELPAPKTLKGIRRKIIKSSKGAS